MPSFRNVGFIAAAALAVAIGMVAQTHHTSHATAYQALAAVGPAKAVMRPEADVHVST
jgi:hypothetical protein